MARTRASSRPPAVTPMAFIVVVVGGAIGVAARALLMIPLAELSHPLVVPAVTLAINLLGSLLLGLVIGWAGDGHPGARLFLGTGVLGGFTTYSAFAVQAVTMSTASPYVGLALIAVSVFGGVLAAALGLALSRRGAGGAGRTGHVAAPEEAE